MDKVSTTVFLIIVFCFLDVFAQENEKKTYELLVLEIEMFNSYQTFSTDITDLVRQASDYQDQGEYDLAVIFLEEALNLIKSVKKKDNEQPMQSETQSMDYFSGNIISGIDYNRQEFELGFEQSDSVLLDELSKPFVGFEIKYLSADASFNIRNSFRYDSENLRNELLLIHDFQMAESAVELQYGGTIDKNFEYNALGYYELYGEVNINSDYDNSDWFWQLKNKARLKKFDTPSITIPDFFRNSFNAYLIKNFDYYNNIQVDYFMELNESLEYSNNDFVEHNGGLSYQDIYFNDLKIKWAARYRQFNFNYQISDSAFENTSLTISFNPEIVYDFSSSISLDLDYNIDIKKFSIKTEQEPDYSYNYINPSLIFRTGDLSSINFGYVYETKKHELQDNLVEQYIKDQDYRASGVSAGFDYTTLNGLLFSASAEYTQRRYPYSATDAIFNIYSDRNILNLLLYAQLPLFDNISLNVLGSYDNDTDIDSDFNDTISSFYTAELTYSF